MLYPGLKRGLRPLAPSGRRALNTHEAPAYSGRLSRLRQGFVGQAEARSVLLIRYPPRVPCTSRVRVKSAVHIRSAGLLSRRHSGTVLFSLPKRAKHALLLATPEAW